MKHFERIAVKVQLRESDFRCMPLGRPGRKRLADPVARMITGCLLICSCAILGYGAGLNDVQPSNSTAASESATTPTSAQVPSGAYQTVGFDVLGGYEYPEDGVGSTSGTAAKSLIPDKIRTLDGKRVQIQGFMIPLDSTEGKVTTFILQGNQMQCCYGVPPRINEVVLVRTKQSGVMYAADTPIKVNGTLHVGEVRDQGSLLGLYALDADDISD
jgi:hypothetical protein